MSLRKVFSVSLCLFLMTGVIFLYGADNGVLDQTTRLAGLCKVWGLLKYYHPDVATGEIDWDAVLIDALPAVMAAGDFESFNQEIENLIQEAGGIEKLEYNPDAPAYPDEDLFKWLKDQDMFSAEVTKKLKTVQKKHVPTDNYYVQRDYDDTAYFINEDPYEEPNFPAENYRLLALFRYWNIVNYFYPYKDIMDDDWDDVLVEFIPRFMALSDVCEYHEEVKYLVVRFRDGHATRIAPSVGCYPSNSYAPIDVRYIENKSIVTAVYPKLLDYPGQLKVGDIILKHNGIDIDTYRNQTKETTNGGNEACIQRYINWIVERGPGSQLTYTILRDGQVSDVTINTHNVVTVYYEKNLQLFQQEKWKILPGNIGYINMGIFYPTDIAPAMEELMDTRAIIFDLRFHARNTAYYLAKYLYPKFYEYVILTAPNLGYPGSFRKITPVAGSSDNPDYYKGKVIILVNENTISHGEYSAMTLQATPGAVVIGNQTSGTDGNFTLFPIPGGINVRMSGLGVYYPDGTPTQRIGVAIDIECKPTVAGIRAGRDEVLEKGIQFIETSK